PHLDPLALFISTPPAPPHHYPLSLHDALPISRRATAKRATGAGLMNPRDRIASHLRRILVAAGMALPQPIHADTSTQVRGDAIADRKSTRLNSSHRTISYAVFCLKKKKKTQNK